MRIKRSILPQFHSNFTYFKIILICGMLYGKNAVLVKKNMDKENLWNQ